MAALGALLTCLLIGVGWAEAGLIGSVTAFVAAVAVQSGLAIGFSAPGTGSTNESRATPAQSLGGVLGAALALVGALYGGWHWGWAWTLGGFAAGAVFTLVLVLIAPKGNWMLSSASIVGWEQKLQSQLATDHIQELAYLDTPRSIADGHLVYARLPYGTYEELKGLVQSGTVLVRVLPPVSYNIGLSCASWPWKLFVQLCMFGGFLAPIAGIVLAVVFLDARYAVAAAGLVGLFLATPYNRWQFGAFGVAVAGVICGFLFLDQPWGWIITLTAAPLVLTTVFKAAQMHIANQAAARSQILLQSLAEDGHLLLIDGQQGQTYRPKRGDGDVEQQPG